MAILWAILAAALYAISSPFSKLLLHKIPPTLMASLLYLGAGIGMSIIALVRYKTKNFKKEIKLTKNELPYVLGMIFLDILAPILLMFGLAKIGAENVSLLNNFEIVATSLIAFLIFKESISKRVGLAIGLITMASILLSFDNIQNLSFSFGSILVLMATICWGLENNFTRMLSVKDPMQVVIIKGYGSGLGSLIISIILKETSTNVPYILATLILGFVAYGLSIYFYVYAQRELGASKTSAYYAIAPFIGVALSFVIFHQKPSELFIMALFIMIIGAYLASTERNKQIQ